MPVIARTWKRLRSRFTGSTGIGKSVKNWIEAVKNQLGAGTTLTGGFWANDLLWQLGVLAYNLSV